MKGGPGPVGAPSGLRAEFWIFGQPLLTQGVGHNCRIGVERVVTEQQPERSGAIEKGAMRTRAVGGQGLKGFRSGSVSEVGPNEEGGENA